MSNVKKGHKHKDGVWHKVNKERKSWPYTSKDFYKDVKFGIPFTDINK